MLNVHNFPPDPRLRPFIHSYVQRESHPHAPESVEPVVARLGSILEFQFAGPYDVPVYGVDLPNPSVPITVIGPITQRRARIVIRGHVQALSVLFEPLGLHTLFGVPIAPLADFGYEGHSILGPAVSHLHQRMGNTASFAQRTRLLDLFFLHRLAHTRTPHPATRALNLLTASGHSGDHACSVAGLAHQAGISPRQIERLALAHAGMTPRTMLRIARFRHALRIRLQGAASWTHIAHAAHYHDQAHMVRDFHAFAGNSPVQTLKLIQPDQLTRLGL